MCARRGRGKDMSRTSYLRRPLTALVMAAALAASVVMAVVVLASPAWAATYTVTTNADSGAGSLRQAIIDANTTTGVADTISFDQSLSGQTITLTSSLPRITNGAGLTIDGGSADITKSGANQHRVLLVTSGKLTLRNLTVADGYAFEESGGIFIRTGTATVSNSTFSGNSAAFYGGGIASKDTLEVSNSTLSGNRAFEGGGIYNLGGTATLKNMIVANSPSGESCFGTISNCGYNLDSGTSCGFPTENSNKDPLLGPLADNGGPTKTHALLAGSPAIDQGNSFGESTDQRGMPRPSYFVSTPDASGGDGSDIGAFELQLREPDTTPPTVISTVPGNGGKLAPQSTSRPPSQRTCWSPP
jgi:predicted outer membrane repeat protein